MSPTSQEIVLGNSKELKYVWEIENFSNIEVDSEVAVYSPIFYSPSMNNKPLQWRIQLYPNGRYNDSKDYIAVFLQNMNSFGTQAVISLSVMNDSHKDIFKWSSNPITSLTNVAKFDALRGWGWPKFEQKSTIMDPKYRTLVNDTLLISCTISQVSSQYDADADNLVALQYNEQLFETGDYSDLMVSIESKEMHLHKVIVASLSPVFEAMFKNDMKESHENVVLIKDIKYDIMKELFRYIYTRKVNNISIVASGLLIAADKYAINGLKMMCESSLCNTLNDDNALERLQLAVMHNTTCLKPKVAEFVSSRLKMFMGKAEFKELTHDCKDEILSVLAAKQSI